MNGFLAHFCYTGANEKSRCHRLTWKKKRQNPLRSTMSANVSVKNTPTSCLKRVSADRGTPESAAGPPPRCCFFVRND